MTVAPIVADTKALTDVFPGGRFGKAASGGALPVVFAFRPDDTSEHAVVGEGLSGDGVPASFLGDGAARVEDSAGGEVGGVGDFSLEGVSGTPSGGVRLGGCLEECFGVGVQGIVEDGFAWSAFEDSSGVHQIGRAHV